LSAERAQPMLAEPPPKMRPTWKVETMVLPGDEGEWTPGRRYGLLGPVVN